MGDDLMISFAALDEKMRAFGFSQGAVASEDLPTAEIRTRVPEWRIGYVVGRSYSEAVKEGSIREVAMTAGRLGAQYGVDVDDLLDALNFGDDQREVVRSAYAPTKSKPIAT
jgi:hypothetical protein